VPTEPRALAKFEQAASIEYAQFDPMASAISSYKVFKFPRDQATSEEFMNKCVRFQNTLDEYEAILGKQKYLAGDVRHGRSVS
jgi:glutathione S-transferase